MNTDSMSNNQSFLKAAIALLIWGGCVRVISTHDGEDNPFNELIKEIRAGKRKGTVHRTTFREAVDQGLYKRVCLRKKIANKAEEEAWVEDIKFYGDAADEELMLFQVKVVDVGYLYHYLRVKRCLCPCYTFRGSKGWDDFNNVSEETRNAEVKEFFDEHLLPL